MQKTDTTPYSPLGTNYSKGSNLPSRLRPHSIIPCAVSLPKQRYSHPFRFLYVCPTVGERDNPLSSSVNFPRL